MDYGKIPFNVQMFIRDSVYATKQDERQVRRKLSHKVHAQLALDGNDENDDDDWSDEDSSKLKR
jgi:hypothetical protein